MNTLIFILILSLLVFIHELGHFIFAKLSSVRVDEFGFGYPPRMFKLGTWKGTDITINWIPFGGFVRLFDPQESDENTDNETVDSQVGSLSSVSRSRQFLVLFGGILFNIILAWVLLSASYIIGVRASTTTAPANYHFTQSDLTVTQVFPDTPAFASGIQSQDIVLEYGNQNETIIVEDEVLADFSQFVDASGRVQEPVYVVVNREGSIKSFTMLPKTGVVQDRYGVGLGIDRIGEVQLSLPHALWYGFKNTIAYTAGIIRGFGSLIIGAIPLDAVSGPVGIVHQVSDASGFGIGYLFGFIALLSLNLAVLNAFPFPALDGGRILVLAIEAITRRRLNQKVVGWMNAIGFFLLIGLMLLVTVKDIITLW